MPESRACVSTEFFESYFYFLKATVYWVFFFWLVIFFYFFFLDHDFFAKDKAYKEAVCIKDMTGFFFPFLTEFKLISRPGS